MKNLITPFLLAAMLLFIAAKTNSPVAEKSTQQVVLISQDAYALNKQIDSYYKLGYRVSHITSQSVSITSNGASMKSNIIAIMEK